MTNKKENKKFKKIVLFATILSCSVKPDKLFSHI